MTWLQHILATLDILHLILETHPKLSYVLDLTDPAPGGLKTEGKPQNSPTYIGDLIQNIRTNFVPNADVEQRI